MEKKTKPTESFNVQKRCEEIHSQYGTTEMANYRLQQMCDKIAQDAFDQGRQSVIDDACILKWKEVGLYGPYAAYEKVCRVETPLGDYSITYRGAQKEFTMYDENGDATRSFKSLEKAKQYASNLHRERLKKALGI